MLLAIIKKPVVLWSSVSTNDTPSFHKNFLENWLSYSLKCIFQQSNLCNQRLDLTIFFLNNLINIQSNSFLETNVFFSHVMLNS